MTDEMAEIRKYAEEIAGEPGTEAYDMAVVLLTAAFVTGANQQRIHEATGIDRVLISTVALRMHRSGLWKGGKVLMEDPHDGMEWSLNVCVAQGYMETAKAAVSS